MKKITALLLTMLMLVSMMSIGISAEEATTTDDKKLVLHYDFEGENIDEAYLNKAYDGWDVAASKTGDLAPLANATQAEILWDKENGTITNMSNTKSSGPVVDRDFARPYMTRAVEYTFVIRAKLADTVVENTGEEDIKYQFIDFNNSAACMLRIWFVDKPGEEADYIRVAIANSTEVKKELELKAEVTFEKLQQEWMNIAFVVSDNGGNLVGNLYTSFGTPASENDWTKSEPLTIGTEIARGTSFMFLLANSVDVGGGMLDDVRLYKDNLTLAEIHNDIFVGAVEDDAVTCAYTVGNEFISFVQLNDEKYVSIDEENNWESAEIDGAMGGTALHCNFKQAQDKSPYGGGIVVTFFVPAEGDYTIWGRAYFETQNSNSMFYTLDGGDSALIWDLPDEDSSENKCYKSWQYFYLTTRVKGTYSDTTKYGEWTIANNEWRHAPNVLHLTAGQHTIRITGREPGMYLDELVITSYSTEEYDPNNFEGNTFKNDSCKFCGSAWNHFYTDVYAQKDITAQTYFTTVLHKDATAWTIPEIQVPDNNPPADTDPPADTGDTPADTNNTPVDTNEVPADTNTDTKADDTTADTTEEKKGGCGGTVSMGALAIVAFAGATIISKKRR